MSPRPGTSMEEIVEKQKTKRAAQAVLEWFVRNQRDLPWRRRQSDPYAIWISEIMLQQTQVETALPYYERFLDRFPTVEVLAAADIEEVLGYWSGLGYYRRARSLHQAARQIVESGVGFPADLAGLKALPGVGNYTAAAVGSIAFGIAVPAIDGNIERVVGRFLGVEEDPSKGEARRQIEKTARELLIEARPGDSNQALMEIGATLCRPRQPLCEECPLASGCRASGSGQPESFAVRRSRTKQSKVRRGLVVVLDRERVLLFRRPEDSGQLAGMWELPWFDPIENSPPEANLKARYGGQWLLGDQLGRVRHAITSRLFDVEIVQGEVLVISEVAESIEAGWFAGEQIETLAVSSLVRKVLAKVWG